MLSDKQSRVSKAAGRDEVGQFKTIYGWRSVNSVVMTTLKEKVQCVQWLAKCNFVILVQSEYRDEPGATSVQNSNTIGLLYSVVE